MVCACAASAMTRARFLALRQHPAVLLLLLFALPCVLGAATLSQLHTEALASHASCAGAEDMACLRQRYAGPRAQWPAPDVEPGVPWQELDRYPAPPAAPTDNPQSPEKIALGKQLFEDPRLSRSAQIACASCHDPQLGWGDGRRTSFGHDRQLGRRNAISIINSAQASTLFWDGRARTLEEQALHPVRDPMEMAFSVDEMQQRLQSIVGYRRSFQQAFGRDQVLAEDVARALAAYQRSLVPPPSRYERFMRGDPRALDDRQLKGLHVFRTRAGCMNCHGGAMLTDNGLHNLGLHFHGRSRQDLGRYEVTGDPADSGRFRTPSLRSVSRTGPWMHNGLFPKLRGVLDFYNGGGARPRPDAAQKNDPTFPQPDPLLRPRALDKEDIDALEAFLHTL